MSRSHTALSSPLRSRYKNCIATQNLPRALHAVSRARSVVSQVVSQHAAALLQRCIAALLCYIATQTVAPSHDTNFVSRLTPGQAMHARSPLTPAHRPAMSWSRVARPLGRVVAPCCTPQRLVSRYNPLYRDSDWKMGSSPSSLLHNFFFFHSSFFFFHFVPPTGRPQK